MHVEAWLTSFGPSLDEVVMKVIVKTDVEIQVYT